MNKGRIQGGSQSSENLRALLRSNLDGVAVGVYSVCSAHPLVLRAALRQALEDGSILLVESTSNQVNQFGGYTGMTAESFAQFVREIALDVGFPFDRLVLGGDHLGPHSWRSESADSAMAKAADLVRSYVLAGFRKIHLDTSMKCGDDPGGRQTDLSDETKTERAARLCEVAEEAWRALPAGSPPPVYVIGTEVPTPGGERADSAAPEVTRVEDAEKSLLLCRTAFGDTA